MAQNTAELEIPSFRKRGRRFRAATPAAASGVESIQAEAPARADAPPACWLCGRPLGHRIEWHHPLPKSRGGRVTVPVHPICHRTIHALFTNAELARAPGREGLLQSEPMRRFLAWISAKPPDFHAPTRGRR